MAQCSFRQIEEIRETLQPLSAEAHGETPMQDWMRPGVMSFPTRGVGGGPSSYTNSCVLRTQGNNITKMQNHVCSNEIYFLSRGQALHYQETAGEGGTCYAGGCNDPQRNTAHTARTSSSVGPRFTLVHFPWVCGRLFAGACMLLVINLLNTAIETGVRVPVIKIQVVSKKGRP